MRDRRQIRPLAALFHIRKLVAQRRNAAIAEAKGNRFHRLVVHAGAGAMREHVGGARIFRPDQQRRDWRHSRDRDLELLRVSGFQTDNLQ